MIENLRSLANDLYQIATARQAVTAKIEIMRFHAGRGDAEKAKEHPHESENCEAVFNERMIALRTQMSQSLATYQMPFPIKQRKIELPMAAYAIATSTACPRCRHVVIQALIENIASGPGHLSVHRAKHTLTTIARNTGPTNLIAQLESSSEPERIHAAHLLGRLKDCRTISMLMLAFTRGDDRLKVLIKDMVVEHFPAHAPRFSAISGFSATRAPIDFRP